MESEIGPIEKRGRTWIVRFTDPPIDVTVIGDELTQADHAALLTLRERIAQLLAGAITDELLELENNAERDTPRKDIFTVYKLVGATLEIADDNILIEVGFEPTWSADHHVTVFLENWQRAGSSIDA